MTRRLLISMLMLSCLALAANSQVKRHEFKVGNFNQLELLDDINVNYRCNADSAGYVVVTCTQEIVDHLIFNISSRGRMAVQVDDSYERQGNLPTLTVYSASLDEVVNSGDSILRIAGLPPLKAFKARLSDNGKIIVRGIKASQLELQLISGKGKIIADGTCDNLSVRLIGTGEIQADKVVASDVVCRIMGTGSIGCHVNGSELKVSGSGTGKVYYKGEPSKVTVRKLGTIKAIPMQ